MDFKPVYSDEELHVAYVENNHSSRRTSRLTGIPESTIRARMRKYVATPVLSDPDREAKIKELIASAPLHMEGGGHIREVSATLYGQAAFDKKENVWVKEGLNAVKARYVFQDEKKTVEWPPIAPQYVVEAKTYIPLPAVETEFERVFIIGDIQANFWREKGTFVPFHDEAAIDVTLQMLARYQPHQVVIIGDLLDLPELGRYRKEPAFAFTLNAAIAYATHLLARIRAIVGPDCTITLIQGNHEARLQAAIVDNLCALYGLRRPGDRFSLLSIPFLLQLDKYNIHCTEQYPSGEVWLTDDLVCLHAPDSRIFATQVCGHLVRATVKSDSMHTRNGRKTHKTYIVPGAGDYTRKPSDAQRLSRTNIPSNVGRSNAEQAMATIEISKDRKRHHVTVWPIESGEAFFKDEYLHGTAECWTYQEAS
jgi:hypothetical protein